MFLAALLRGAVRGPGRLELVDQEPRPAMANAI
jgi:hypothetical protein